MANSDYLPDRDAALRAWLTNFTTVANANLAALGLIAGDVTPVSTAATAFGSSVDASVAAAASAQGAVQTKDTNKTSVIAATRPLVARIQSKPGLSNALRQQLGIGTRGGPRTPSPVPTTRPIPSIDTGNRLQHIVSFRDDGSNTKAKPKGVRGCEIWATVLAAGAPGPSSASQLSFIALDTKTPYLAQYNGSDAGKTAWYWLRWINTRGETGPWSEPASATIAG